MPARSPEANRAAVKRHYDSHPDYYRERNAKRRTDVTEKYRAYKESRPCADCGNFFPYYVMHFDHLGDKVSNVSKMVMNRTWASVLKEIEKCDLVCANCHAYRTFNRAHVAERHTQQT